MKFNKKIFQSKIARRIFLMFVSCALLPVVCFSIIAYGNVTKQLHEESYKRLQRSVKGYGLSIYEKLLFLETELKLFASSLNKASEPPIQAHFKGFKGLNNNRFKAVAVVDAAGKVYRSVFRTMNISKKLTTREIEHMQNGDTAISVLSQEGVSPSILMMMSLGPRDSNAGYLIGEINTGYLWGTEQGNALPPNTQFCVLDASESVLFSSISYPDSFYHQLYSKLKQISSGQFEFPFENKKYLTSYRTIFMKPRFLIPGWTVVLNQSKADVLMPMSHFKTIFPFIALMTLLVVLLFSMYSIRKSLVPLESLKNGTRRIAMREFDFRVNVKSGDEFEELAMDFNEMADQLNRQFKTLETMAEVDRAILSSLDTKIIIETIIHRIYDWFICDSVAINLTDSDQNNTGRVYLSYSGQEKELFEKPFTFSPSDLDVFQAHPKYLIIDANKNRPSFLSTLVGQGIESFLILPVFLKERLKAVIAIGRSHRRVFSIEDITKARQTADQVAVALSNATLIEELDQLNWGTLKALARTVDAKSSWTAGHSTRVTETTLRIGSAMRLPPNKLDDLHRAALLHDIGKVGVPAAILDKPGALDDDEYALIKKHPAIGARILEPIASYKDILPMVVQHHERYDGKGYPGGLSGDEIDIGARILAVADTFDAVKSDRPYRKGWALERAIDLITKEAGHQFDPDVVEAFLEIMRPEKIKPALKTRYNIA
jgi:HD-GYP domain-containing protein (c-di-GMP phosphodiesterase class II)/HAMP domain-containing protein